jgi:hypothetical protein
MLTLNEISAVLGLSKPAASALKNGKYPAQDTVARYESLLAVVERVANEQREVDLTGICETCPREDCAGCRIAELID